MKVKLLIILLFLIPNVVGYQVDLDISTKGIEQENLLTTISYKKEGTNSVSSVHELLENGTGKISLSIPKGKYQIAITADKKSTPAPDYYGIIEINESGHNQIKLDPIGFISGEVLDSRNNLRPNVSLKFDCINPSTIHEFPTNTDSFGSVSAFAVHTGPCKILAKSMAKISTANVMIEQGRVSEFKLLLGKEKKIDLEEESNIGLFWIALLVFLVAGAIIIIIIIIIIIMPNRKSKTYQAVMKTLTSREKKVIECLKDHKGETTQAKIHHTTGIAKSNLFRTIQSLENKGLIESTKVGKIKRIKLMLK